MEGMIAWVSWEEHWGRGPASVTVLRGNNDQNIISFKEPR